MTRTAPTFASGVRQNLTITAAAGAYALSTLPDVATDDMIVLVGVFININQTVTALGGWTQLYLQNVNTRCWGVWYRRRLAGDAASYSTPTVSNTAGGNTEFQQSAWRGVDWGQPFVSGTTFNRASSVTATDAPSITLVAGSTALAIYVEATNATENDGSETFTAGWTKAVGYANQTVASVSIEHALLLYKAVSADGATGVATSTWLNASLNGAGVQIGLVGVDVAPPPPVGPSVSPLDATAVRFWDGRNNTWVSPSRGPKGATGPTGATGPAASERVRTMTHRSLGAGQSIIQGWVDLNPGTTALDASEAGPALIIRQTLSNPSRFRFLKTGAYLVTANVWIDGGAPPAGERCFLILWRAPANVANYMWAQNAFFPGQGALTMTTLVLANAGDLWWFSIYKSNSGTNTHTSRVDITPVGPCRVDTYEYTIFGDYFAYNSAGAAVSSYSITPDPVPTMPGDWMYLIHENYRQTADLDALPPQGWESLVPTQRAGTSSQGLEWSVWRKKYVAGDICTVTLPGARICRGMVVVMRQPNDDKPSITLVAPRQGVNPSKVTAPAPLANSTALSVALQHVPGQSVAPPPTVSTTSSPGGYWGTAGTGAAENLWLSVAWLGNGAPITTPGPVDFNFPAGVTADAGQIGGLTLSWPRVAQP